MLPHSSLTASPALLAPDLDERCVTTIRLLAADAVERAGSGHPGLPMGAAPMALVLCSRFLHFDPSEPKWPDRDRFVLPAGHGSMLHYADETVEAWRVALERRDGRTVSALTRQAVPVLVPSQPGWLADFGARVVVFSRAPDLVLIGTGSEVALCIDAAAPLGRDHRLAAHVVSMPWRQQFCRLEPSQRDGLLPPGVPRLVVEAGVSQGWEQLATTHCLDRFGASAPGPVVMEQLGFSVQSVVDAAMRLV